MKKQESMIARLVIVTLALAGVLVIPAAIIGAQSDEPLSEEAMLAKSSDKSERMEGSWVVTVTPAVPPGVPAPPPFRAYGTFARGGAAMGSDGRRAASKQHGTWAHLRGNEFAWTLVEQLFNESGEPTGTVIIRTRLTITGANEFVGVSNGEERDAAGNLVSSRCGTIRGERITIQPLAPQCQNIMPPQ